MIDPKLNYCTCGHSFKIKFWQKLWMLLFQDLTITCPQCQSRMKFRLIHHTVKVETKPNKKLKEVYKNA